MINMHKFKYNDCTNDLDIDPRFIADGICFAEQKKYASIRITDMNEQDGRSYDLDLTPISGNQSIHSLTISDNFKVAGMNINAIYTMENLKQLSFRDKKINIDFSRLPQLEILYIKCYGSLDGFSSLKNLKHLLLISPIEKDCYSLIGLESLQILRLSGGKIETLSGIEGLKNLASININRCSHLKDISMLGKINGLVRLYVEKCKLLNDYSFLAGNDSIEEMFVSDIDSIDFVPSMGRLNKLHFWNLKDGQIDPVLESNSLKAVYFYPNKRHYSYTQEQIISLLAEKIS